MVLDINRRIPLEYRHQTRGSRSSREGLLQRIVASSNHDDDLDR